MTDARTASWAQRARAWFQQALVDDVTAVLEPVPDPRDQTNQADERSAPIPVARGLSDVDDVIGDCAVYEKGRRSSGRLPLSKAAQLATRTSGFVWIGLQQPTEADIAVVAAEFSLPLLAVEDAIKAHQRPKLEIYDDVIFVVLKPVTYVDHEEVVTVHELAIFLGPNFVVSVRHGDTDILKQVRAQLDAGDPKLLEHGRSGVLYRAADLVVDGYLTAIEFINEDVDQIESQVFSGADADDHSERIYKLKREVSEFRRAVQPLAEPLQRLADGNVPGIGADIAPYFRDVHDHVLRAADAIEGHDRLLSDVLQAELARISVRQSAIATRQSEIALEQNEIANRQNEDMRKISAWAAIALVPTAVAGIYGMNFDYLPELTWHYGYYGVLGVIAVACGGLYALFRRNGWL